MDGKRTIWIIGKAGTGGMGRKGVKNMRVKKICMIGAAAVLLAVGIGLYIGQNRLPKPVYQPIKGFSNMCAYEGKVYEIGRAYV